MPHKALIALTPQTDERNFPQWQKDAPAGQSGHPYPKMLCRPCTEEYCATLLEKNQYRDMASREISYGVVPPKLGTPVPYLTTQDMVTEGLCAGAGQPIIVNSPQEEQEMLARFDAVPAALTAEPIP